MAVRRLIRGLVEGIVRSLMEDQMIEGYPTQEKTMENDETRRTAAALYKAHELFLAKAQPHVSPQAFDAYLLVVQEEGLPVSAYMARAGVSKSIMSRWLLDIGDARSIRPGMGLVTIAPVEQSSGEEEYTVVLTPKGHELAARITACFGSQEPPAE